MAADTKPTPPTPKPLPSHVMPPVAPVGCCTQHGLPGVCGPSHAD